MLVAGNIGPPDTKVFPNTIVQLSRLRASVLIAQPDSKAKGCTERNPQ